MSKHHTGYRRARQERMLLKSTIREIKDPKQPLRYLVPPVKVSHSHTILRHGLAALRPSLFDTEPWWTVDT